MKKYPMTTMVAILGPVAVGLFGVAAVLTGHPRLVDTFWIAIVAVLVISVVAWVNDLIANGSQL